MNEKLHTRGVRKYFSHTVSPPLRPSLPSCFPPSLPPTVCRERPRVYSPAVLSGPPSCRLFAVCFAMCFRETPRTDDAGSDTTSLPPLFFSHHSFYIIRDHYFSPSPLLLFLSSHCTSFRGHTVSSRAFILPTHACTERSRAPIFIEYLARGKGRLCGSP